MPLIAVDIMGADNGEKTIIEGVLEALHFIDDNIILVGDEKIIKHILDSFYFKKKLFKKIEIEHSSQFVTMEDQPIESLRKKTDSSLANGLELLAKQKAAAFISAGNTGAFMVTAIKKLGLIEGLERPAIATLLPNDNNEATILIDSGANVDCKPKHLFQFALMGSVYSQFIFDKAKPKIGLLSIGTEAYKGNEITKQVFELLKKSNLNFIGNIEGTDVFKGTADVVVCDGFVGNIVLKISEQVARTITKYLKDYLLSSIRSKIGTFIIKPELKKLRRKILSEEYGGAPLLGVNGYCIKCHGSSNATAIKSAILTASRFIKREGLKQIKEILNKEILNGALNNV